DRRGGVPEGLGVAPAFDMYETLVSAFGGRMGRGPVGGGVRVPARGVGRRDAGPGAPRIVFVTNPHNPSGVVVERSDLVALARAIAPVLLFVDEAYIDFGGETLADERRFPELPALVVADTPCRGWVGGQAAESRPRLTAMGARLGLPTWPSQGNFILVRVGAGAP